MKFSSKVITTFLAAYGAIILAVFVIVYLVWENRKLKRTIDEIRNEGFSCKWNDVKCLKNEMKRATDAAKNASFWLMKAMGLKKECPGVTEKAIEEAKKYGHPSIDRICDSTTASIESACNRRAGSYGGKVCPYVTGPVNNACKKYGKKIFEKGTEEAGRRICDAIPE